MSTYCWADMVKVVIVYDWKLLFLVVHLTIYVYTVDMISICTFLKIIDSAVVDEKKGLFMKVLYLGILVVYENFVPWDLGYLGKLCI